MFLSNWLMITRVVAASVVAAVDYPSPEDFFMVFDGTNQLFMYGGSVDSASNVAIYFEDYKHELGNAWPVTVSEPGDYKALVDVCGTRYLTEATTIPTTKTVTSPESLLAFHHGNFDDVYGDGDVATAATNGHVYADTPLGTYSWGTLTANTTTTSNTTYQWAPPGSGVTADYLIVGGGGGGQRYGNSFGASGGGAGGFLCSIDSSGGPSAPLDSLSLSTTTYDVVVGAGGAGGPSSSTTGSNGNDSSFNTLTAKGGGGGGNGLTGGSGGGGTGLGVPGSGTSGQGNSGGTASTSEGGSGGGGAGADGGDGPSSGSAAGGIGVQTSIRSGTLEYFAGGGGSSPLNTASGGAGGLGGGGNGGGTTSNAADGEAHTGGGGGASKGSYVSGNGGSGIVLMKYTYDMTVSGVSPILSTASTLAFHHGNFDNVYGDVTVSNAATNGHVYADTPTGTYSWGTLTANTTTTSNTTYQWTPVSELTADVLMVAGGGGGGSPDNANGGGGGGGAGGLMLNTGVSISGQKTIVVGHGARPINTSGHGTTFTGLTNVIGGGAGIRGVGLDGGSGGGGGRNYSGGSGTPGQGHNGGSGSTTYSPAANQGGSGGGGAGGPGIGANGPNGANGGPGVDLSATFGTTYGDSGHFASGGGGGYHSGSNGTGPIGGGGNGGATDHGQNHTGGGGGGGYLNSSASTGFGGSGIVLLSYQYSTTQLSHDTYDKLIIANTSNANTETNLRLGSNVWDLGEVGNVYISKPGDYKSFTVDPDGQVAHFGNVSVAAVTASAEGPPGTTPASLTYDTYNKLMVTGQTDRTLYEGSNTYALGTASNVYIADPGDYTYFTRVPALNYAFLGSVSVGSVTGEITWVDPGDTEVKIQASDKQAGDHFGYTVAIDGDYAIVGARDEDTGGTNAGAAYIFKRDGTAWTEQAKILASDIQASDGFGSSVAISGDYAIVGAPTEDTGGSNAGAAYIFKRVSGAETWTQRAKIQATSTGVGDYFGYTVAIDGDNAVVGAPFYTNGTYAGAIYIFKRDSGAETWDSGTKIQASDIASNDYFAQSVAISGDYVIVGAYYENGGPGYACIFKYDGTSWSEEDKIVSSDKENNDEFGVSVAIDGDYAVVGAQYQDPGGTTNAGAAYIFKRDGTSWTEQYKIQASDKEANDKFGGSVAISGNYVIVGATQEDPDGTSDAGAAYIFKRDGTVWSEQTKIHASDKAASDLFGYSVAISGDYAVVGARDEDTGGTDAGAAYIYSAADITPQPPSLAYDGITNLKITGAESSSYITYKSHSTNKLLACGTDLTTYRLYQPGNYRALVGGPTTFTFTSNVVVPATEILPMYVYPPPATLATNSLTESVTADTDSTWELEGASYGNGVYNAQASITATTSNTAYHAFDSNVTAGFESSTSTGSLTLHMPSAAVIRKYVAWPYNTGTTRPSSWTLQGSTDGNSWSTLHAVTTTPPSLTGDAQTLTSFGLYDRYRLNVTANAGGTGLKVAELALWGDVPLDTTPTFSDSWTSGTTSVTLGSTFTLPTVTNITGLVVTGSVDSTTVGIYDVSWSKPDVSGIIKRVTRRFEVAEPFRYLAVWGGNFGSDTSAGQSLHEIELTLGTSLNGYSQIKYQVNDSGLTFTQTKSWTYRPADYRPSYASLGTLMNGIKGWSSETAWLQYNDSSLRSNGGVLLYIDLGSGVSADVSSGDYWTSNEGTGNTYQIGSAKLYGTNTDPSTFSEVQRIDPATYTFICDLTRNYDYT